MNERAKRVLILTVTAGNGHNSCAKAMAAQLTACGAEVKIVDYFTSWHTPYQRWTVDDGYNLACTYALRVYNACYKAEKRRPPQRRYSRKVLAQKLALCVEEELLALLDEFRPDVIYCTHFYPAVAIGDARLVTDIPAKLYLTTFDYTLCPYWDGAIGVDYINLATPDFVDECLRLGYRREQFLYCGIPVAAKFSEEIEKPAARRELGIAEDMFTVMVMFGGGQWSGGYKIFRQVLAAVEGAPAPVQIIMINGRNKKDKDRIDRLLDNGMYKGHRIVNVGFTDRIELYMSASDAIVTKLGGTSATECINKLLPIVAAEKLLPQQEADNAVYLRARGAALTYKNTAQLSAHLLHLMTDDKFREGIKEAQRALRLGGIKELAEHILSQPYAEYSGPILTKGIKKRIYAAMDERDRLARRSLKGGDSGSAD